MTAQLSGDIVRTVVETSSGAVAALRMGDPSDPAVLMLPGYTGSKEDFAALLPPFARAGYAVTAIDLPGQFESAGPAHPGAYTPSQLAPTVLSVAATLGRRVHLIGHSFGGLVARAAVIADMKPFGSLVLMCSGPSGIGGARRQLIEYLEPVLAESGMAAVYAASQAVCRAQPGYREPPPAMADFLQRRFLAGTPEMLQGMGAALHSEPDRVAELADVSLPKLVLYGADDDAWPPDVQDDMARRLRADRAVITDAAHSPASENPAATATAITVFWHSVRV